MPTIPIYSREKDGSGATDFLTLTVGRYEFEFDTRLIPDMFLPNPDNYRGVDFTVGGKRVRLEEIRYQYKDPQKRKDIESAVFVVTLIDNPIPIVAVVGGIAAIGVGLVSILLLKEVRKVIEPQNVAPLAFLILLLIVLVGKISRIFGQ